MPIQITITAAYAAEARAEMRELLRDGVLENRAADEAVKRVEADEAIEAAVSEPTEAEPTPEPAKRKRRTKAEIEADKAAEEPQQNISASPEDRQEPEAEEVAEAPENLQGSFFDDEEAPAAQDDMIDGYAITDQGLQAVMHAYVAKFDMAAAQTNAKTLFGGFNKRSEVAAAGEEALRTAIANFARAIKTGKEV